MSDSKRPDHFLRLGIHSEQGFFESNKDKYDIVVLNANLAFYFASATATLMSDKLKDKRYIIDPITHAFGHNPRYIMTEGSKGEPSRVKSSLEGLGNYYGAPISTAISIPTRPRPVTEKDFSSSRDIAQLAERVITFQEKFLVDSIPEEDQKYFTEAPSKILRPCFFIAPYFYMESSTIDRWLKINQDLITESKKLFPKDKVYGEIVIDRGILDNPTELKRIADAYLKLDVCDGYLLWISDLSEHDSALSTLSGLKELIRTLKQSNKPIINLFGGYFSLLLTKFGLSGVCHGPGYGEERDVIPVGGGLPTSKFYLTPIHQRLLYRHVEIMVRTPVWPSADDFYKEVCAGPTCKTTLDGNLNNFYKFGLEKISQKKDRTYSFPTTEARFRTTQHYLEAKLQEFDEVAQKDLGGLIKQIQTAKKKYDHYMTGAQLRYLDTWVDVLQQA